SIEQRVTRIVRKPHDGRSAVADDAHHDERVLLRHVGGQGAAGRGFEEDIGIVPEADNTRQWMQPAWRIRLQRRMLDDLFENLSARRELERVHRQFELQKFGGKWAFYAASGDASGEESGKPFDFAVELAVLEFPGIPEFVEQSPELVAERTAGKGQQRIDRRDAVGAIERAIRRQD